MQNRSGCARESVVHKQVNHKDKIHAELKMEQETAMCEMRRPLRCGWRTRHMTLNVTSTCAKRKKLETRAVCKASNTAGMANIRAEEMLEMRVEHQVGDM